MIHIPRNLAGGVLSPQRFPGVQSVVCEGRAAKSPRRGDPHVVQARGTAASERGDVDCNVKTTRFSTTLDCV